MDVIPLAGIIVCVCCGEDYFFPAAIHPLYPVSSSITLYPFFTRIVAAVLLRLPLLQFTAMIFDLGNTVVALLSKSFLSTSMLMALSICPSLNSSSVRTSKRMTLAVSLIASSYFSTERLVKPLSCAWHEKTLVNIVMMLIIKILCVIVLNNMTARLLVLLSQEVVDSLYWIKCTERHLYEYSRPIAHGTIP